MHLKFKNLLRLCMDTIVTWKCLFPPPKMITLLLREEDNLPSVHNSEVPLKSFSHCCLGYYGL